jgi:branched-chain amino acid transport system permease protein
VTGFFFTYEGQVLINYALIATVVLGFYLTFISGQVSFAHQLFMGIGAYMAGYASVTWGLDLYAAMPLAIGLGAVAAAATAIITLRLNGMFLAIATLAISESGVVVLNNFDAVGGVHGLGSIGTEATGSIILTALVIAITVTFIIDRSSFGLWLRSTGTDPIAAQAVGIRTNTVRIAAFALGGAMSGLAGSLYAFRFGYLEPVYFGLGLGVQVLLAAKLGGTGSVLGPLLGAAFVVLVPEVLRGTGLDRDIVFGALLIIVVILRPGGLIAARGTLSVIAPCKMHKPETKVRKTSDKVARV